MSGRALDAAFATAAVTVVFGIALLLGIHRSQDYEEQTYYLPAYRACADAWPRLPATFASPMPPAGLWVHGAVQRFSGRSVLASRLLNLALLAATAAVLWGHAARTLPPGRRGEWLLSVLCHPTIAASAFLLKPNAWALLWAAAGLTLGLAHRARATRSRDLVTAGAFTLGTLGHQMVTALAAHDALEVTLHSEGRWPDRIRRAAVRGLPVAAVLVVVVLWGGLTAPGFRDHDIEKSVGLAFRPGHLFIALVVIGAWVFPWVGVTRSAVVPGLVAWPLAALGVHATGILRVNDWSGPYMTGAVRSLIAKATGGAYLPDVVVAGGIAAVGAAVLVGAVRERGPHRSFALLVLVYVAMMTLVPYHYEQYYMLLVVGGLMMLGGSSHGTQGLPWRVLRGLVAVYGLAYAFLDASYRG
jgi:hypothetical protein